MQIKIKATQLELTPAITEYIEMKIKSLEKMISRFEVENEAEIYVEIARTTKHHKSGNVFRVEANLSFKGGMLRTEHIDQDIRAAVDKVKDKLKIEIQKFKEKKFESSRPKKQEVSE